MRGEDLANSHTQLSPRPHRALSVTLKCHFLQSGSVTALAAKKFRWKKETSNSQIPTELRYWLLVRFQNVRLLQIYVPCFVAEAICGSEDMETTARNGVFLAAPSSKLKIVK